MVPGTAVVAINKYKCFLNGCCVRSMLFKTNLREIIDFKVNYNRKYAQQGALWTTTGSVGSAVQVFKTDKSSP